MIKCKLILAAGLAVLSSLAQAQSSAVKTGTISNLTFTPNGMMIMMTGGPTSNCTDSAYGWMLIPEANKTLVIGTLSLWLAGQRTVAVYTWPKGTYAADTSVCQVWQIDPVE